MTNNVFDDSNLVAVYRLPDALFDFESPDNKYQKTIKTVEALENTTKDEVNSEKTSQMNSYNWDKRLLLLDGGKINIAIIGQIKINDDLLYIDDNTYPASVKYYTLSGQLFKSTKAEVVIDKHKLIYISIYDTMNTQLLSQNTNFSELKEELQEKLNDLGLILHIKISENVRLEINLSEKFMKTTALYNTNIKFE